MQRTANAGHRMRNIRKMFLSIAIATLLFRLPGAATETASSENAIEQEAQALAGQQRWEDIVRLLGSRHSRSADMDFHYGTALARLERWPEAEATFEEGFRAAPNDPRFAVEAAGAAFKQRRYSQAARLLRKAIKLEPRDSYANDFLGTVYFLQGNLEAALRAWNRIGKPAVEEVEEEPRPRILPALLDRAFEFSPAATLRLPEILDSDARVRGLEIFPKYQFDLRAREDGNFDLCFRAQERNGFGDNKWEGLFPLLRGLPFSSVDPEYYNLKREAVNFVSQYRWDAQKRRIYARLSAPFERGAKQRIGVAADLRDENWAIRNSFTGSAPVLGSVNLRREELDFSLASYARGRLHWSAGGEISHRNFRGVVPGSALTLELLAKGYQLKQKFELSGSLLRLPERRFTVDADASSQAARLWSLHGESFAKLQGSLGWRWFPRAAGDDYEMRQQFRAGKTIGQAPFDELFMLGLERDNDLPMRAHIGTRDGRKGSAPLGSDYFLANWEMDKSVYGNGIGALTLGPFLDVGKIADATVALGSHLWLCDLGAQAKLRVFGNGVVFSYGKDLRTGNNAFYVTLQE